MSLRVPLFSVSLGREEEDAVLSVLRSGWLTMGERVEEFETSFARDLGVRHAIAVSNCTAALHLAALALDVGSGDEVIMPSLTFVATANSVRYGGGVPVFADVRSVSDWTVCPQDIERRITPRTRAIIVVHYAGYSCDMDAICEIANRYRLSIIEDCAHAPGAALQSRPLGTWGDIGCFSFFSNKNMTTGEGGMLVTQRDDLAAALRALRSHGMTTSTLERHRGHAYSYDVMRLGFNYRMTEMQAALGLVQGKRLADSNRRRAVLVEVYRRRLARDVPVSVPFQSHRGTSACHIMPVLLPELARRQPVMEAMRGMGVQTSVHYRPVHTFSAYRAAAAHDLALTETIGARALTLPLFPTMTEEHVDIVVEALRRAID